MQCREEIEIRGYVGREVKTPSATNPHFITFSVGVQSKSKDFDVSKNKTNWYQCITGNEKSGEYIKKYFTVGSLVWIRGIPKLDIYKDKNQETHAQISITITACDRIYGKEDAGNESVVLPSNNTNAILDDEIPF